MVWLTEDDSNSLLPRLLVGFGESTSQEKGRFAGISDHSLTPYTTWLAYVFPTCVEIF